MKTKNKIICQITPENIEFITWQKINNSHAAITKTENYPIKGLTDEQIGEKIGILFKKNSSSDTSIIISLPRILATCRYIKIPSLENSEIEKMVRFQASRFLPYPANEIISAFSVIEKDSLGFSHINIALVHKDAIERLLKILKISGKKPSAILLSSYSIIYWCRKNNINLGDKPCAIINIDSFYIEIVIICKEKLLFSRAIKIGGGALENITSQQSDDESLALFASEMEKTFKSYHKETERASPEKIIITGTNKNLIAKIKDISLNLPCEYIIGNPILTLADNDVEDSLNLLPVALREQNQRVFLQAGYKKIAYLTCGAVFFISAGLGINYWIKKTYLDSIKQKLEKINPQIKFIEKVEKQVKLINGQMLNAVPTIDKFYEIYQLLPNDIYLTAMVYEENGPLTIRGIAQKLSSVFNAVDGLNKSNIFSDVKVRYATRKQLANGESVDFEIVCPGKNQDAGVHKK